MSDVAEEGIRKRPPTGRDDEIPQAITDYLAVDLGPRSEAVAWLDVRTEEEETEEGAVVTLTGDLESAPAGLTPSMSAWYARFISARRNAAIESVRSLFERDRIRDVPSILLESELDAKAHECAKAKHRTLDEFYKRHADIRRDAESLQRDYDMMLADEGGRKPRMVSPVVYVLGLLFVVMLEVFLNFESFMSVRFINSPFLATGITSLVALGIGWASHLHGSLLRQWDYYFGPHDKVRRYQGWRMSAIGGVLLMVALGAVLGARYYYILPKIQQAILLGVAPPSLLGSLLFMIAGNVIVYLVGCTWAYVTHDEIPDYPTVKRRAEAIRAKYDRAFRREVAEELTRLDQKLAADQDKIRHRARAQESSSRHAANRSLFGLVRQKDDEVCAVLLDYRARLTRKH